MSTSSHQDLSSKKQKLEKCPDSSKPSENSQIGYFEIFEYPSSTVITFFLTFGGALGGFILWLPFAFFGWSHIFELLMTTLLGGAVIGAIPSLIVALKLVKQQFVLKQGSDWRYLFGLGAVVSFVYMIFIVLVLTLISKGNILTGMSGFYEFLLIVTLSATLVGGLSSLIIGGIVLPKQ